MDSNRDQRIDLQDVISMCRKYLSFERKAVHFTPVVEERLSVARRLFNQFDTEKKGYLTEKQVPYLLQETYKTLGKNFSATESDVKSWVYYILFR